MILHDFNRFVRSHQLVESGDTVLLAVSGGIDSTVMARLFHQAGLRFALAHCNFSLRGGESDGDEQFVAELAQGLDACFHVTRFDTKAVAEKQGVSVQMAARDLRYAWFEQVRKENGYACIATAHHLDDQAETFMINLIRGTGIAGLHGIPVRNGNVIRPLMFARRHEIEHFALENGIRFRTDSSNDETKYLRNRIRHEILPLLEAINPGFSSGLHETIRRIGGFEQIGTAAIGDWLARVVKKEGLRTIVRTEDLLKAAPSEPFAWALLEPFGFNETQVANLLGTLNNKEHAVFTSSSSRLVKERGRIVISGPEKRPADEETLIGEIKKSKIIRQPIRLSITRVTNVQSYNIPKSAEIASLDIEKLTFPLTLRRWQPGDAFFPLGMRKKKKLSDFFIDSKFTVNEKENAWLVCSGKDIAWIVGHRIDNRFKVTASTREILRIEA